MTESLPDRPFALLLGRVRVRCRPKRPIRLTPRDGATLATTLRGAFGTALLNAGCARRPRCGPQESGCPGHPGCPVLWLWKPYSESQRRHHAPPVALSPTAVPDGFILNVRLWGRHAIAAAELVLHALAHAGRAGLIDTDGAVPFSADVEDLAAWPLGQWVEGEGPQPMPRLLRVDFETPCDTDNPSLPSLAAQVAHDLVQWQLEDEGESTRLGKRGCDTLAEAAKAAALQAFAGTRVTSSGLHSVDLGRRASRRNGRRFNLAGFVGTISLAGDLARCFPWLQALALRGAGGRRAFGLGTVRLRLTSERLT